MSRNQQNCNSELLKILRLLEDNQRKFEELRSIIKDPDLRQLLFKFIENSKRYVNNIHENLIPETNSLKLLMKGKLKEHKDTEAPCEQLSREECMERCRTEESSFEKTYREVLNSFYIQGKLKKTMQFQFNDIKVLFLKIRINDMIKTNSLSPHRLQSG